jgi:N-acetylgalactosamine kinase
VCSSSLAIAAVLGVAGSLTKGDVSEFTCTAERHVGVTSGGMDQAISVMGMPGVAMLVEFNPVRQICTESKHVAVLLQGAE